MQTVVKHFKGLEHMPPVLAFVVHALVQHIHYFVEFV
jgi:hypothetical protein